MKGKDFLFLLFVFYSLISLTFGKVWAPLQILTWNSGSSNFPSLAVDSTDRVHLVWSDNFTGNSEIYYRKSTDMGETWSAVKRLTWLANISSNPIIVVDSSDHIHLVWIDSNPGHWEIYYKNSSDGGNTWTPANRLTWGQYNCMDPAIAVDSGTSLHICWQKPGLTNYEIYYKKSTNSGTTWSSPKRLSWNSGISENPTIAVDHSGSIHVAWDDSTLGAREIFYKRSSDGGSSWSPLIRLTWNSG